MFPKQNKSRFDRQHTIHISNVQTLKRILDRALQLTHWGRVTHICVRKLTIIATDNGLSPGRRQAIIWTNAGILLIGPLGTNFSEILIEILSFSLNKIHLKMSSGKWRPFCLSLNVLTRAYSLWSIIAHHWTKRNWVCCNESAEGCVSTIIISWLDVPHGMMNRDKNISTGPLYDSDL